MPRLAYIAGAAILWASCSRAESGDPIAGAMGSAARPGASYSAELAKDLAAGSGAASGKPDVKAGDPVVAKPGAQKDGGKADGAKPAIGKPGAAKAGDAKPEPAKPGDAKATQVAAAAPDGAKAAGGKPGATPGDAKAAAQPASVAKPGAPQVATAPPADAAKSAPAGAPGGRAEPRGPVRVSRELAEIKLSLLPNWDRDIDEAGTFQYVVRVKGTQATKTFRFHYGYDEPTAPADRDQYKKYLQDTKRLTGDLKDRQRGGAWFLEGLDASGLPAFRYVVLYGNKRLICYGSLYKDAESSRLGDDRDQTVIQAKQICETLAL